MAAGFPPKIATIEGNITIKELLCMFKHLILYAQSTVTTWAALNFLYLVVPALLWGLYSLDVYPNPPQQPAIIPPYHQLNTQLQNQIIQDAWQLAQTYWLKTKT